jgi:hypothetical protein
MRNTALFRAKNNNQKTNCLIMDEKIFSICSYGIGGKGKQLGKSFEF